MKGEYNTQNVLESEDDNFVKTFEKKNDVELNKAKRHETSVKKCDDGFGNGKRHLQNQDDDGINTNWNDHNDHISNDNGGALESQDKSQFKDRYSRQFFAAFAGNPIYKYSVHFLVQVKLYLLSFDQKKHC